MKIRTAESKDAALILQFIRDLASYEKALDEVKATENNLQETLFSDDALAHGLICEIDQCPVGFAVYFYNYSTWLGQYGLYLEDLYISPEHRGSGAGKALLQHLAKLAIANNCGRFEWNVLDWNTPAREFYEAFSATPQSEWVGYRLQGEELRRFAAT